MQFTDSWHDAQVAGTAMQVFLPHTVTFQNNVIHSWLYTNAVRCNTVAHCVALL
jgi:hypothetical protein